MTSTTRRFRFGPGLLVTAAFIGPGTITTASSAGAHFGFALLWALLFSIIATYVLQEMSARLGLATRAGLAEAMRAHFSSPVLGKLAVVLVVLAIGVGNAAYEAGNIAGASLALSTVSGIGNAFWSVVIGLGAALLLASGRYAILEGVLIVLVLVMSVVFVLAAVVIGPSPGDLLRGLLRPTLPEGSVMVAIALIGTTVVPYNLFLHANAVREKWPAHLPLEQAIHESRLDSALSIGLGGLITLAIVSTAATAFFGTGVAFDGSSLALQLEPLLGPAAHTIFAAGLFAGGLTSAITAPLAASYAVCGALGWSSRMTAPGFRLVWIGVLVTGTLFAAFGTRPLSAILLAQMANGLLLPVVAVFLLLVMNSRALLGTQANRWPGNLLGGAVVAVAVGLGGLKILDVAGWL
jgi:Mn2+/Fe2+ NRAMP family transporter